MSSTPEEWAQTAHVLFSHRRYTQAAHSFDRAGLPREKDVACAYHLREQARMKPTIPRPADISSRLKAYVAAAEAFIGSAKAAAHTKERLAYYRIAAECFADVESHSAAAQTFLLASEYTRAAQHYRKAGLFDEAVAVIRAHREDIPAAVSDKIIHVAKIHYFTKDRLK